MAEPAGLPLHHDMSFSGTARRFFSEEAVADLLRLAGGDQQAAADPGEIAAMLEEAAIVYIMGARGAQAASASVVASWAKRVRRHSEALLKELSVDVAMRSRGASYEVLSLLAPDNGGIGNGPDLAQSFFDRLNIHRNPAYRGEEPLPPNVYDALRVAIHGVRLVRHCADQAVSRAQQQKGSEREADLPEIGLFVEMQRCSQRAFGKFLTFTRRGGQITRKPGINFAAQVLTTIADRLHVAAEPDPRRDGAILFRLRELAQMPEAIAGRLKNGKDLLRLRG
jgi:hypothetical protein